MILVNVATPSKRVVFRRGCVTNEQGFKARQSGYKQSARAQERARSARDRQRRHLKCLPFPTCVRLKSCPILFKRAIASMGSDLARRTGALATARGVFGLFWTCSRLTSTNLVCTSLTRESVCRSADTNSRERAIRKAPPAANLSATSLPWASNGEMSPAAISASATWLLQTLYTKTGGPMTS